MRFMALLSLLVLTACTSPLSTLVSERESEVVAPLVESLDSREARMVRAPFSGGTIAIRDIGPARSDRAIVFVHGVFSDHETWRFVAGAMEGERCLLVDLPGSGDSDPLPDSYAPDVLSRALDEGLRSITGVDRLVVVGHSLGTQVSMRLEDPRIDTLVLVAPVDQRQHLQQPVYRSLAKASRFRVWMADMTGVLESAVVDALLQGVEDPGYATREHAEHRMRIIRSGSRLRATQSMILDAIAWESDHTPDWAVNESNHSSIDTRGLETYMVVGGHDELLPAAAAFRLAVEQGGWVSVLRRSRHSPHRDAPREVASVIRASIEGSAPVGDEVYDLRESASRSGSSLEPNRSARPIDER